MLACSYREGLLGATMSLGVMGVMMRECNLARGPHGVSFMWSVGVAWGVGGVLQRVRGTFGVLGCLSP